MGEKEEGKLAGGSSTKVKFLQPTKEAKQPGFVNSPVHKTISFIREGMGCYRS